MVYSRKLVERAQFKRLPFRAVHFLASNLATAPSIKHGRRSTLGGWSTTTGRPTMTAVADTSVAVVKVPAVLLTKVGAA